MTQSKTLLFLAFTIITISCNLVTQKVAPDIEKVTYRALLQHHEEWQKAIKSINGNLRLTLDTPEYSGNFNASVLMNEPDSLLITVTGPFGMHLGKVYISKRRFIFYNQVMNQFYKGSREDFKGKNFLQFPLEISQLKDVFVARDPFDVLEKQLYEIRDDKYYIEAKNGNYSYKIWFDPEVLLISRIEYLLDGKTAFIKEYDNFRKVNGIYFPHLVNFIKPDEKQGVSIIISSIDLNQPIDRTLYEINVSDSAKQIDLTL